MMIRFKCSILGSVACFVVGAFFVMVPWGVMAQSLTVPNGDMESPVVGAWSTTLPADWTWSAGSGVGDVGLTSTGGANGSQQTLYGNTLAGSLTSLALPQTFAHTGTAVLTYWVKRENSGNFTNTANLIIDGNTVASRTDTIQTDAWEQFTVNYPVTAADVGKTIQIQFAFSGSGNWQGYLDEVALAFVTSESFSSEDEAAANGWVGFMNTSNSEDYGWSDTQNAGGGNPGEAGGSFVRGPTRNYYADITVGSLTLNDYISASGTLFIAPPSHNAAFGIGYFNTNDTGDAKNANVLGIGLADGNYPDSRISATIGTADQDWSEVFGPLQVTAATSVPWSFSYDPTGGTGYGELTVDYTVNGTGYSASVALTADERNAGADFNAFGMMVRGGDGTVDTENVMGIYMADVTYTKGYSLLPPSIPLQISPSGSDLILSWTNPAFLLEFSTNVAGPYAVIPGATTPFTNNESGTAAGFFRLVSP